jgi:hypothetical protein
LFTLFLLGTPGDSPELCRRLLGAPGARAGTASRRSSTFAELLIDEEDRTLRAVLVGMLRAAER